MVNRIGFYSWSGADTVEMIRLKYFNPPIDSANILSSYSEAYIEKIKNQLGVTDIWATFSWGFGFENELEQYNFIIEKIKLFHNYDIRVHAYIQGPNRVYNQTHKKLSIWAKNAFGSKIFYHSGRYITCIQNPVFLALQDQILDYALNFPFDGIFIDNIWMGQIPLKVGKDISFFGCKCWNCKNKYYESTGKKIPDFYRDYIHNSYYFSYQNFRIQCVTNYLKNIAKKVHNKNIEFGWNSYDGMQTEFTSGLDLEATKSFCDYFLFENHSLPGYRYGKNFSNQYLSDFIQKTSKPVFIVSYKEGIGLEPNFSKNDIELILAESKLLSYAPCFKGGEFVTDGVWHNLKFTTNCSYHQMDRSEEVKKIILQQKILPIIAKKSILYLKKKKKRYLIHLLTAPSDYFKMQAVNIGYHGTAFSLAKSRKVRKYFEKKGIYRKIYAANVV